MAVSGAIAVVGAIASASSAYSKGKSDKNNLKYKSQVAANNAIIAQDQSTVAELNGQEHVNAHQLQTASLYGMERANLAASGVDLGQGSANDILTTTQFMAKRDENTIQDNALREAWGFKVQKNNASDESAALRSASDNINPSTNAFTSLLGSVSNANDKYNQNAMATGGQTSGQWMKSLFA